MTDFPRKRSNKHPNPERHPRFLTSPLYHLVPSSPQSYLLVGEEWLSEGWEERIRSEKALPSSHRCIPCVQLASMERMQAGIAFQATSVKVQTHGVLYPCLGDARLQQLCSFLKTKSTNSQISRRTETAPQGTVWKKKKQFELLKGCRDGTLSSQHWMEFCCCI